MAKKLSGTPYIGDPTFKQPRKNSIATTMCGPKKTAINFKVTAPKKG